MYRNKNGWFPEDFDPATITLLIEVPPKRFKKRTDTLLKNFPCRYQFTNTQILPDDINEYRYIFKIKDVTHLYVDYYIYDRLKDINYSPTGYYTSWDNAYFVLYEILKYIKKRYGTTQG